MNENDRPIRFCPYCGTPTEIKNVFGEDRPACPACHWVHFADPKVAAAALVTRGDEVLLVQRIFEPHKGDWALPAGFVNAYEDPARAAERECLEETGLQVRVTTFHDMLTGREHALGADIVLVFDVEVVGGLLSAGDDAAQARYFSRRNLPPLAFTSTKKILG